MAYVDKVKKDNQEWYIKDARVPEVTNEDVGKTPVVQADGTLAFEKPSNPVEANPELEGGEDNLNSIKIGDTKYKVAGFMLNSTSGAVYDESRLNLIYADHQNYYVDYHIDNGYRLNATTTNFIISSKSEMDYACMLINYGLQVLGLQATVTSMGDIVNLWETYGVEQNYAFLLMGLIILAFNNAGVELRDHNGSQIKYYVSIDEENPMNSTMTQYIMTEDTTNGYELKYIGTHYTIADTTTIMAWSFSIE